MKRCIVLVCLLSLGFTLLCADSIGDNFVKRSKIIGVLPAIYYDSPDWAGGAEAIIEFLVRDDLTMGGRFSIVVEPDTVYINVAYVMSFIFGYNPEAAYGPAHRVGVKLEYLSILEAGYEGSGE
jgi:hypothetical protein